MAERLIRPRTAAAGALPTSLHPVLRRVYAQRGLVDAAELALDLSGLLSPDGLKGMPAAAALLAAAITQGRRIIIAGDYDCDGATGTAVAILGLRALGATAVDYVVPNRFTMGYGLSPELAQLAAQRGADLLVTVDNGIASIAGVAAARALGMQVLITDHHLAGAELPAADALVNPNQPGCDFASKHLAGVGVMFYVLLATRAQLREQGWFAQRQEPNLATLLDLVALGTVADLVTLDRNNRILVAQGLARLRVGRTRPGLLALLAVAGRDPSRLNAGDLGFVLGPRINAAGRLDDIRLGIECLLSDSEGSALELAQELERINRERRGLQAQMNFEAEILLEDQQGVGERSRAAVGVSLFDENWHEGVVGLVASKIKERLNRPAFAFARAQEPGLLKASGRSITGLHIRDALAAVDVAHPGLILRFGGHAMAAGLSLSESRLHEFAAAFDQVCRQTLRAEQLDHVCETDGELGAFELNLETASALEQAGPWGQGFAEPRFDGVFEVLAARLVGSDQTHVKYSLRGAGGECEAIDFGGAERLVSRGKLRAVYALGINRYQGRESVDLRIEYLETLLAGAI